MSLAPHPALSRGSARNVSRLLTRFRTDLCVIQRPTSGTDAGGAPVGGFTAIAVVPCRIQAAGRMPIEAVSGGRVGPVADYELYFDPGIDIRSKDRIAANGKTMDVVSDFDAQSHGFELKVLAKSTSD